MSENLIELRHIGKRFGGVRALDDVSFAIKPGEIHCLAGENGSGKSTIIKVMSGVYTPEDGEILIDGKSVGKLNPVKSVQHGIQVIYQDFSLFGNLTVAENLAINTFLIEGRKGVDWKRVRELAQKALDRLGVSIDLDADVDSLPTSGKQIVAIARAVMADARLIIMDEPTTALTRHEVDALFRIVRDIQAQGIAVLFVSHKMREMLEISERLTVFRNGKKVAEGPISDFDEPSITRAMTGQELTSDHYHWGPRDGASTNPTLEIRNLTVPGSVENASLALNAGEIVGISGLIGSGRTELALALFGMKPDFTGTVRIEGKQVHPKTVQEGIDCGIAYVPEDRLTEGLFLTQSIERNIIVTSIEKFVRGFFIDRKKADATTREMFSAMHIVAPGPHTPVNHLSGGNAQRVVLARWLLTGAKVLILNGPTVGVDVGSKAQIHNIIRKLARDEGLAVLMISDDVPELVQNCNRVLVMHRGRFVDELSGETMTEDAVNDRLKTLN
ncbi:simple sugar transport system ATP-binding protein [Ochrobactrum daejeonense]|uniref:Simple sugar transport system ATP-binding protein n=1 Tax=Brucella daejeonensis TaxID=659015 RepID=A0A7W9B179_9HYPH|nr:sugar ABC transporter ATP-binding protein [Brucella daejeonensis]MBB5704348.1 simple sugar transport system ATP-binding protein [Brucella daejeonensis]NKB79638.1 sugar ABC transporter ATP-binding protein [Brucella daejeonensis]